MANIKAGDIVQVKAHRAALYYYFSDRWVSGRAQSVIVAILTKSKTAQMVFERDYDDYVLDVIEGTPGRRANIYSSSLYFVEEEYDIVGTKI
jgi:hypothetical protein